MKNNHRNQSLLQKMILISPELMKKWKQLQIEDEQLSETDKKLKSIISNKSMNDIEKWYNYRQILLQNPHKFRYWRNNNENIPKSIGTQSENKNYFKDYDIPSLGEEINIINNKEITVNDDDDDNRKNIEAKPFKLFQNIQTKDKKLSDQELIDEKLINIPLEENPSIKFKKHKKPNLLERRASADIVENVLKRKALSQLHPGAKIKLQKIIKSNDQMERVTGARYHDEATGDSISVNISTDDDIDEMYDDDSTTKTTSTPKYQLRSQNAKQVGKGITNRKGRRRRRKLKINGNASNIKTKKQEFLGRYIPKRYKCNHTSMN